MESKKYYLLLLIIMIFYSCNFFKQEKKLNWNRFSGTTYSQEFGDSLRIELEDYGRYKIYHYIDLDTTDSFDHSYTSRCTYDTTFIDTIINLSGKLIKSNKFVKEKYDTDFSGGIRTLFMFNDSIVYENPIQQIYVK